MASIQEVQEYARGYCDSVDSNDCETDNCIFWKNNLCYGVCEQCFAKMYEVLKDNKIDVPEEDVPKNDNVNHPTHYTDGKYECIEMMIELFGIDAVINFCQCNVFKYRFRSGMKNGQEDKDKADWYMEKMIELKDRKRSMVMGVMDELKESLS